MGGGGKMLLICAGTPTLHLLLGGDIAPVSVDKSDITVSDPYLIKKKKKKKKALGLCFLVKNPRINKVSYSYSYSYRYNFLK